MSKTKLGLVAVYLQPELKKQLEEWAKEEDRTVSKLAARILEKALTEHQQQQSSDQ